MRCCDVTRRHDHEKVLSVRQRCGGRNGEVVPALCLKGRVLGWRAGFLLVLAIGLGLGLGAGPLFRSRIHDLECSGRTKGYSKAFELAHVYGQSQQ